MTPDEYYPFIQGQRRRYRSRAPGARAAEYTVETLSVGSAPGGALTARFRNTVDARPPQVSEYEARKTGAAILEQGEKVLPEPQAVGARWEAAGRAYELISDAETVTTAAGTFRQCLKVQYLIAGGDAGSGARYYAPGVGLVKEECADEADPFVSELIALK